VLKQWTFFDRRISPFTDQPLGRMADARPAAAANTNLRLFRRRQRRGEERARHGLRASQPRFAMAAASCRGIADRWFRPDRRDRLTLPIASPDQATIFDPTTGVFDTSLRGMDARSLVALQDAGTTALCPEEGTHAAGGGRLEDEILQRVSTSCSQPGQAACIERGGARVPSRRCFTRRSGAHPTGTTMQLSRLRIRDRWLDLQQPAPSGDARRRRSRTVSSSG
jgi:hypothetical protein